MNPLLHARALCKIFRYRRPDAIEAIMNIDLEIDENQFVVFGGASGSGKTTLMNLLGGILRPTKGDVCFRGRNLARLPDNEISRIRRDSMGFILQNFFLLPHLKSWENVSLPLIPIGVSEKKRCRTASQLLESLGLGERINHTPEELSGGEQQRVAIARALINDPDIILADEPASNIDTESCKKILSIFRELHDRGKTILVNTHNPAIFKNTGIHFRLEHGLLISSKQGKKQ